MAEVSADVVHCTGPEQFRQRLALSVLSGRSLRITDIRPFADKPGLTGLFVFSLLVYTDFEHVYAQIHI